MDFGQPNVEIGQKIANGQLLFLALWLRNCGLLLSLSPLSLTAMSDYIALRAYTVQSNKYWDF